MNIGDVVGVRVGKNKLRIGKVVGFSGQRGSELVTVRTGDGLEFKRAKKCLLNMLAANVEMLRIREWRRER